MSSWRRDSVNISDARTEFPQSRTVSQSALNYRVAEQFLQSPSLLHRLVVGYVDGISSPRTHGPLPILVIRYGFGGTLFAQDGSQVYLKGGKTGLDRSGLYCTRPDHLFSSQCPAGSPRKIRQKKTPSNHPQSCLCQSPLPLKTVPSPRFPSARRQVNPQYLLERRFLQK
jgi:hypothetical protein